MKYVCALLLTAFLLAPTPASAQNAAQNTVQARHPEWFACAADNDCALTCQPCGNAAINGKFMNHSSEILLACLQAAPCFPDAAAQCVDKKCAVKIPDHPQ